MFRELGVAFLLGAVGLNTAQAQPSPIMGTGAFSCGQWVESRALKEEAVDGILIQWQLGFLSGMNFKGNSIKEMVILPDAPSILLYMDNYCKAHPLEKVMEGSLALYQEMVSAKAP